MQHNFNPHGRDQWSSQSIMISIRGLPSPARAGEQSQCFVPIPHSLPPCLSDSPSNLCIRIISYETERLQDPNQTWQVFSSLPLTTSLVVRLKNSEVLFVIPSIHGWRNTCGTTPRAELCLGKATTLSPLLVASLTVKLSNDARSWGQTQDRKSKLIFMNLYR